MTEPCCDPATIPKGPWGKGGGRQRGDQVAFSERGGGFAYRPLHIHCHDKAAAEFAATYIREALGQEADPTPVLGTYPEDRETEYVDVPLEGGQVLRIQTEYIVTLQNDDGIDLEALIDELRDLGCRCEHDYVLFNDAGQSSSGCGCECGFGGNPIYASPIYASPIYASSVGASGQFASPIYASPIYASPIYASPIYASPIYGSTYKNQGMRSNTARPVAEPERTEFTLPASEHIRAIVLDTGIAAEQWRPPLLQGRDHLCGDDPPDIDQDKWLDPASGHGTFIAGIIEQLAPSQDLWVRRVLSSFGDGDIAHDIVPMLYCLLRHGRFGPHTVLNLSFGGYADREMKSLARAIRRVQRTGAVVVASAGNDATCRPAFPACLPGVIGVGALDDHGPAPYSNHGPWVRACAPGTDLVSAFYNDLPLLELPVPKLPGSGEPAKYEGWARWTGTSFAAPVVTAALVRHMAITGSTAKAAVAAVIDAPGLYRFPGLGTVVNMVTPTPDEP